MVGKMKMWRALSVVSVVLLLAGCASLPAPKMMVAPHRAIAAKVAPAAAVEATTPNAVVKKRWFSHFRKHPMKWLH